MSDLISRQNAIDTVFSHRYEYENKLLNDYEQGWNDACDYAADEWLESLPSAETPTYTQTDLISREDAIALVIKAIHGTDNKEIQEYLFDGLRKQMWSLPSADRIGNGWRAIDYLYQCNKCGWRDYVIEPPKCCPNCGEKVHPLMERRY